MWKDYDPNDESFLRLKLRRLKKHAWTRAIVVFFMLLLGMAVILRFACIGDMDDTLRWHDYVLIALMYVIPFIGAFMQYRQDMRSK